MKRGSRRRLGGGVEMIMAWVAHPGLVSGTSGSWPEPLTLSLEHV